MTKLYSIYIEENDLKKQSRQALCSHGVVKKACSFLLIFCTLLFVAANTANATVEVMPKGSKIINMGSANQTIANGLKPYGLVYALLKLNVPVKWVINQSKIKDGIDFTHNGVSYKTGAFIIQAQYLTASVNSLITTWVGKGVLVNTTVASFSIDVTYTLNSPPRWVMDATTGYIAVNFLKNAEIPSTAYIFKGPAQLDGCDDIYVMPHAVPTWATHKNLYYWNLNAKGAIWSGCHAVSNMENSSGPDINTPATIRRMNFLMSDGPSATQNAVPYYAHNPGTPKYTQSYPTHPIMQFLGATDKAQDAGYETVYLPNKAGSWRPTTLIGVFDPSQQDVPSLSNGAAGIIAFGRGFGDPNRGLVMYEAGHDIASATTPDNIAAQRAFFNFSFFTTLDKKPGIDVTTSSASILTSGQPYSFSSNATSPSGAALSYQWSSSCGGTFSNPTGATTMFTPATVGSATVCNVSCKVSDACGRSSFDTRGITVIPATHAPVCVNDVAAVPNCAGNIVSINVLANDTNVDGGALTVSLVGNGSNGTFTNAGNGIINYVPNANFNGSDVVTYSACNATGQCSTATITVNTNLVDAHGCTSSQFWGVASSITAASAVVNTGVTPAAPSGLSSSYGDPDGDVANTSTYTNFNTTAANDITYTLSSAVATAGTLKLYVDATTVAKSFTVSQSTDNTTFTNPVTFTANTTDDFLESTIKGYPVNANTKYIKISFAAASGTVQLDAMVYEVYSCISANITANNDAATTVEDVPATIEVLSNDVDPQNQKLIVTGITSQPAYGKVSINFDNTITYLNVKDQTGTGTDNFSYRVCNSSGQCSTASVTVSIVKDNSSAGQYKALGTATTATFTASADTYLKENAATTAYGTATDIRVKGKTDGSRERGVVTFNISSIPSTAIIDSASLSLYEAANAYNGNVSIYRSTRAWTESGPGSTWNSYDGVNAWTTTGGDFDAATIWSSINVGSQNNMYKNWNLKALVQGWVKATYSNYGIYVMRNPEGSAGTFREMRFNSNNAGGNLPSLYVRYKIPSASASTIPAYAPLAMPDTATTNAVTPVTIKVATNDYDYNGSGMTVSFSHAYSQKGGKLTVASNIVTYTPPATPYYNGVDTFTYLVTSSGLVDSANVYVMVTDAPPRANVDSFTMASNTVIIPNSTTNDVAVNDNDPEGSTLTNFIITQDPANGVATISGSQITYTPNINFIGRDTLIYQVTEATGTGCTMLTDTAMVIYKVTNRAPIAAAYNDTTNPCQAKVIEVLANDYDPEGGDLTIEIVTPPSQGTATLINNNSEIQFTPPSGVSNTTITFTYRVYDDAVPALVSNTVTASIFIRSGAANNAPVARPDTFHIFLNDVLYADVLRNDYDPDNDPIVKPLTLVTSAAHGAAVANSNGTIQYTPNNNFYGIDSFYYKIYDDVTSSCVTIQQKNATALAYIIIQEVPIANSDYVAIVKNNSSIINVRANDIFGVDGPASGSIVVITAPKNGNISVLPGTLNDESDDLLKYIPATNYSGADSLIYQICDSNGDCDTAMVRILVKSDHDYDGIPDDVDLDDDNDGIPDVIEVCGLGATSFSCMPNGSDPAGDDDQDGVENWRDPDFGTLNAKGCVAFLDSDGDGIPDFLDLDSDNDGIPDVVEAGGADSDGDGMIDNFCDTDGDGLSQNVDANNTGAAGSGNGLGFKDFDGDGVPNSLDLDSDNDGIPDIIEEHGVDANNDGRVDNFTDMDGDGWADAYDGDADGDYYVENLAAVLIVTGPDNTYVDCNTPGNGKPAYYNKIGNDDNQGLPNFLDLDSDGDGITDATESGITATAYNRGMVTGCTLVNGWCSAIQALPALNLRKSDSDSRADAYDIDSDNDGITDNVEAQPTGSYVMPTDADTDGDGIADVYDFYNGLGGNGITPYDHDNDGIPDYRDTDSDNDGAPDRNEGDKRFMSVSQATIDASGDTDDDGLMDYFDTYDLRPQTNSTVYHNIGMGNMGPLGNFNGPIPSGSTVQLVQSSASATNRDWRNNAILPLQIVSFAATLQNTVTQLTWKVENEQQVLNYQVQRSSDGFTFETLAEVSAKNASSATYNYDDNLADYSASVVYYRIVQVNKLGDKLYTKVISFNLNKNAANRLNLYPNPANDVVNVSVSSITKQFADIIIADAAGKVIIDKKVALNKGLNIISLTEIKGISKGLYSVSVKSADEILTQKLVVQ